MYHDIIHHFWHGIQFPTNSPLGHQVPHRGRLDQGDVRCHRRVSLQGRHAQYGCCWRIPWREPWPKYWCAEEACWATQIRGTIFGGCIAVSFHLFIEVVIYLSVIVVVSFWVVFIFLEKDRKLIESWNTLLRDTVLLTLLYSVTQVCACLWCVYLCACSV